jgi:DNA-binding NtrC family response regulator
MRRRTGTFRSEGGKRPVLYQLCRAGERFEVGDGPVDLAGHAYLTVGRGDPSQRTQATPDHLWVDDPWMSSKHAELFATRRKTAEGGSGWWIEDCGSTNGVVINGQPVRRAQLQDDDLVETGRTFWLFKEEPADLLIPTTPVEYGGWNTFCPPLAAQLEGLMEPVAAGAHILVAGPEGSGKGFMARTIHRLSGSRGPLDHLDCRERSASQLEVDLFGDRSHGSRLRRPEGGTLFLENIDTLPLALQRRVVVALGDQRFLPSADSVDSYGEVRVVGTTMLDPHAKQTERILAPDFLAVFARPWLTLPPLTGRRQDLGLLLDDFLARARAAPAISREACRVLLRFPFEQHVKGLGRVIEAGATLALRTLTDGSREGMVDLQHLPVEVVGKATLRALLTQDPGLAESDGFASRTDEMDRPLFSSEKPDDSISPSAEGLSQQVGEIEAILDAFDDAEVTDPIVDERRFPPVGGADPSETEHVIQAPGPSDTDRAVAAPGPHTVRKPPPQRPPSAQHDLAGIERSYAKAVDPQILEAALRKARGNVSAAARYLGKPRALVLRWMREFEIDPARFR